MTPQIIPAATIWNGSYEYTFRVELWNQNRSQMLHSNETKFVIFKNTISPQPTKFVIFGDSLSDMGNTYNSIARVPESPPYYNGRFSNGPVWAEFVASSFSTSITHGSGSGGGENRAFGGARSGSGHTSFVIPNTGTQITDYTNNHWFSSTEIVALWIGGNDYMGGNEDNPQDVVDNIHDHVVQLVQNGASNMIVIDMPSLDKTPSFADESDAEKQAMHARVRQHNSLLASDMAGLEQSLNVTISMVAMLDIFESIYWNGSFYGITNNIDTACQNGGGLCDSNDVVVPNPNEYIFFDDLHPTANIHSLIGKYVIEQVGIPDLDGDGVEDDADNCPTTPPGDAVNHFGCRLVDLDSDEDGVNDLLDQCPATALNSTVDEVGCALYQLDSDGDGISDDIDICSESLPQGVEVDEYGCAAYQRDSDDDGINDLLDSCPDTEPGWSVTEFGCAQNQLDDDWDSVMNHIDLCPSTPSGEEVDVNGCSLSQLDSDSDGVNDALDLCAGTPAEEPVNEWGCSASQTDGDGDGIMDNIDLCEATPPLENPDASGCSPSQRDSDGDGRSDALDECVFTAGSIRGCPRMNLIVEIIHYPISFNDTAEIRINASCEFNCMFTMELGELQFLNQTSGESEFTLTPRDSPLNLVVKITNGSSWAEERVTILWGEPPKEDLTPQLSDEESDEEGGAVDSSNSPSEEVGWEPSNTVQALLGLLILFGISITIGAIGRSTKRSKIRQPDWRDASIISTLEVTAELATIDSTPHMGRPTIEVTPAPLIGGESDSGAPSIGDESGNMQPLMEQIGTNLSDEISNDGGLMPTVDDLL